MEYLSAKVVDLTVYLSSHSVIDGDILGLTDGDRDGLTLGDKLTLGETLGLIEGDSDGLKLTEGD